MPDPAPAVQPQGGPQGEYAGVITLNVAQQAQFAAAITLKLEWEWEYDNCNNPPQTPTNTRHWFAFTAQTLDPNQGGAVTWTTPNAPLVSTAN